MGRWATFCVRDLPKHYRTISNILCSCSTKSLYDDHIYFVFVIYLCFIWRSATFHVRDLPKIYTTISNILCSWFTSALYDDQQHFIFVIYLSPICRSATFWFVIYLSLIWRSTIFYVSWSTYALPVYAYQQHFMFVIYLSLIRRSTKFCLCRNLSKILWLRLKIIMTLSETATGEGHSDTCELLLFYFKKGCHVIYRGYLPLNDATEYMYWNGKHWRTGKEKVIQLKYHRSDWAFYERSKQITSDPTLTAECMVLLRHWLPSLNTVGLTIEIFVVFPN